MSFILTEEQEVALSEFLNRENKIVCEKQILEETIPKEFRDLIQKTIESGSPVPFFDPVIGYYSISFTPCEKGNRIYAHHHITDVSEAIYDPSLVVLTKQDVEVEKEPSPNDFNENVGVDVVDPSTELDNLETINLDDSNSNSEQHNKITNVIENDDGIYFPK